jgi:hypothetical protein
MGEVIGDLLPLALGVAISPVPIMAVILMLFSASAVRNSFAFLVGWIVGVTAVIGIAAAALGQAGPTADDGPATWVSVLKLVLGLASIAIAVKQWHGRPEPGEQAQLPSWMEAIDSLTPGKALGIGLLLSSVNPKNLALGIAGGVVVAQADLGGGDAAVCVVVFVLLSSVTIAGPVLANAVMGERAATLLDGMKRWLGENDATVMAVLMLVIGVTLFGKGLGALL